MCIRLFIYFDFELKLLKLLQFVKGACFVGPLVCQELPPSLYFHSYSLSDVNNIECLHVRRSMQVQGSCQPLSEGGTWRCIPAAGTRTLKISLGREWRLVKYFTYFIVWFCYVFNSIVLWNRIKTMNRGCSNNSHQMKCTGFSLGSVQIYEDDFRSFAALTVFAVI